MLSFLKIKPSLNHLVTDVGKSCPCCKFLMSQICLVKLFMKINSSENFQIQCIASQRIAIKFMN